MNRENLEKSKKISELSQSLNEFKIKAESISDHDLLLVNNNKINIFKE